MRNSWTSKVIWLFFFVPMAWAQPSPLPPGVSEKEFGQMRLEVERLIHSLRSFQPPKTLVLIEEVELPENIKVFFRGWTYHQMGDYAQASKLFHQIKEKDLYGDSFFVNRLEEFRRTADNLKDFAVLETPNFSIRYQEGHDKVMVLFLPDILEQVYARYSQLFNYKRDEKIIVELMPDFQLFSDASALTREQIETTGTIALCVENRLVALTPRRVAQGYYWPDVIAHEFVHYILTKLGEDEVPLWMQEGTAKFFESRWNVKPAPLLDEGMESVLAVAIKNDKLLGVNEMMPSFAALPTATLAMQAYAQTATMIQYLCDQKGEATVRNIIVGLREEHGNMDRVLTKFLNQDFASFESDWKTWLKTQTYKIHPGHEDVGVKLLDSDAGEEKVGELSQQDQSDLKFLRLGDLLLERNRYEAALKEYRKIQPKEGRYDRQVVLRLATCLQQLNLAMEQVALMDTFVPDLEGDTTMILFKARALLELHRGNEAESILVQALRTNPFHPGIYQSLITIKGEDSEASAIYREALQLLAQPSKATTPKEERKS